MNPQCHTASGNNNIISDADTAFELSNIVVCASTMTSSMENTAKVTLAISHGRTFKDPRK